MYISLSISLPPNKNIVKLPSFEHFAHITNPRKMRCFLYALQTMQVNITCTGSVTLVKLLLWISDLSSTTLSRYFNMAKRLGTVILPFFHPLLRKALVAIKLNYCIIIFSTLLQPVKFC